jgi:hypothetical protein
VKFILKTALKILVLSIILVIPVGLLITCLSLNQRGIPVGNLGVRNILLHAQNYSLLIFFISYLLSSLLVTSLIDKLKVKSIIALHLPALIVGAVFAGGIYFTRYKHYPLPLSKNAIKLDYKTFIRDGVFHDVSGKAIMLKRSSENNFTLYLYDKTSNDLSITGNLSRGKIRKDLVSIDEPNRVVQFTYKKNKATESLKIPFSAFTVNNELFDNPLINRYLRQIRIVMISINRYIDAFSQTGKYIFSGVLYLSVLMILIPLTYALNDRGWGFAGLIGIIVLLAVTPFFYGAIIKLFGKISFNLSFLRQYSYLSLPLMLCLFGVFLDILVKITGKRTKQNA